MGDRTPGIIGGDPLAHATRSGGAVHRTGSGLPGPTGGGSSTAPTAAALQINGWPRTLTWGDFTDVASRPTDADEDAQIHSEAEQPSNVSVHHQGGVYSVANLTISLRTVREDTWVVMSQKIPILLDHEQGHYDITGLMARDMGNDILAARARTVADLQTQINQIIATYRQRASSLTSRYDTETNHSRNREAQQRWNQRIRESMQNGTRFSAP